MFIAKSSGNKQFGIKTVRKRTESCVLVCMIMLVTVQLTSKISVEKQLPHLQGTLIDLSPNTPYIDNKDDFYRR